MKVWVAVASAKRLDNTVIVGVGMTEELAKAKLVSNIRARWKVFDEDEREEDGHFESFLAHFIEDGELGTCEEEEVQE